MTCMMPFRTVEDKQRDVKDALLNPELMTLSDRIIAKRVCVSHAMVTNSRRKLEESNEIPRIDFRTVIRRGAVRQMNTANIGFFRPGLVPAPQPPLKPDSGNFADPGLNLSQPILKTESENNVTLQQPQLNGAAPSSAPVYLKNNFPAVPLASPAGIRGASPRPLPGASAKHNGLAVPAAAPSSGAPSVADTRAQSLEEHLASFFSQPAMPIKEACALAERLSQATNRAPIELRAIISPEWSKHIWASHNIGNRPWSEVKSARLANDLIEGRWVYNGMPIYLSPEGILYNGQHRLRACILAGLSFQSMVMFNATKEMRDSIDIGIVRTSAHIAAMNDVANPTRAASLATMALVRRRYGLDKIGNNFYTPSKTLITQELLDNGAQLQAALVAGPILLCPPAVADFANYMFREKDPARAAQFMGDVLAGDGVKKGSPAYALRKKLVDAACTGERFDRMHLVAFFVKAWDAFIHNRRCQIIRWNDGDPLPAV